MFKKIYIEITNRCNLACSFCLPSNRPKGFMRPAAFEEILRKTSGHTDHLSLHVLGEALLHPDLELFLAMCTTYGLRVNLTTNGSLLSKSRRMLLQQPALRQINISLRSFEGSGEESSLNSYMDGIFDFITAVAAPPSLFINLRMWNSTPAATPKEQTIGSRMLKQLEDFFRLPSPLFEHFSNGRGIILAPRVFLSREHPFAWPHAPAPDLGGHGYCRGLRDHIAILVDGTVVPCCLDAEGDMPLGNIFQSPLTEILSGPRASLIRDGFARQKVLDPVCRRCSYRQRFQRTVTVEPASKHLGQIGLTAPL